MNTTINTTQAKVDALMDALDEGGALADAKADPVIAALAKAKAGADPKGTIRLYMHKENTRELMLCYGEPTEQENNRDAAFELVYGGEDKQAAYDSFVGMATLIESTHG